MRQRCDWTRPLTEQQLTSDWQQFIMEPLEAAPPDSGSQAEAGRVKHKFSPATAQIIGGLGTHTGNRGADEPVMCECDVL